MSHLQKTRFWNTGAPARWLITLLLAAFFSGVAADIQARFGAELSKGAYIPRSFLVFSGLAVGALALALLGVWRPQTYAPLLAVRARLGRLRWALAALLAAFPTSFFLYTRWSGVFAGSYMRGLILLATLAAMAWLATGGAARHFSWTGLLASAVLFGSIFSLAYAFQGVVGYPFSLSWSEGNRIWDYSLRYGRRLYDYPLDRAIHAYIDRGRQSLWGLPFLLPKVSILGVRLWSALVFTLPYAILGWLVFWPRKRDLGAWLFLGLWSFLFLNQGPIYTPLVLAAILVALAIRSPLLLAAALVGVAGYYARTSRYTWMFAPGIWAAVCSLAQAAPPGARTLAQRWGRTIVLALSGLLGGYAVPQLLAWQRAAARGAPASPGVVSVEGLSATLGRQPLLWERLWPNPTNPLGIVYGLLLAAGPLLLLVVYLIVSGRWKLDVWQKLALAGSLLAFLAVGIVVSVKIGGGSNLHNLDMFLIGLLFAAGLAWEGAGREQALRAGRWLPAVLLLATVFYPAAQGMFTARPNILPPAADTADALEDIQQAVDAARPAGEILFIDQRQLLTFGYIQNVPLTPDYEKKYLMDQAMAEDAAYFEGFFKDLAAHRFALILTEPLRYHYQGESYQFGNENDAWVKWVSTPLLCYYEPVYTNRSSGVQMLHPKEKSPPEEGLECPPY